MSKTYPDQFLGLPPRSAAEAEAVVIPLPLERTVSYGRGTAGAPRAILAATGQIETFDEETEIDLEKGPPVHTAPAVPELPSLEDYLKLTKQRVRAFGPKFVLALGGEHTITAGVVPGLAADLSQLTVVQIDAHADLIDRLDGRRWSHGTVMRRLYDSGCRLVQIGLRSASREEYELIRGGDRIQAYFAHQLPEAWPEVLERLGRLRGPVYLSVDVDGLDPGLVPSTGTPQPDGLSWRDMMQVLRAIATAPGAQWVGADVVELIPAPHPPGSDAVVAKLLTRIIAYWATGRSKQSI